MKRALLLLLVPGLFGQQTIRVTTRLIEVNVVVEDKHGRPVPDLTRYDFTILDEKHEERISTFSVQRDEVIRTSNVTSPPQSPNTYTNRLDFVTDAPRAVTVIMIDQLNTEFSKQRYNRDTILQIMSKLDSHHRVALYALGSEIYMLHDFTSDTESLLAALRHLEDRLPAPGTRYEASIESGPAKPLAIPTAPHAAGGMGNPGDNQPADEEYEKAFWARMMAFDKLLADAEQTRAFMDAERRARLTLNAIEAVSNHLARIPGRKNLIWVCSGFPTDFFEYLWQNSARAVSPHLTRELDRAARALANANVAVYPVHAGDTGGIGVDVEQQRATSMAASRRFELKGWDTMLETATRTGGRAFGNISQFQNALNQALSDASVSYTLGYYPSHSEWNGKFRNIKVKVNREGVRVRHRAGYFALDQRSETPEERRASLQDVIWSPLDARAIPMDVRIEPASKPNAIQFVVMIDPASVVFTEQSGAHVMNLDVLYVEQAVDGRNVHGVSDGVSVKLTPEEYERAMKQKIGIKKEFDIAEGAEKLRIVVRDTQSGAVGSVTVPLKRQAAASGI